MLTLSAFNMSTKQETGKPCNIKPNTKVPIDTYGYIHSNKNNNFYFKNTS